MKTVGVSALFVLFLGFICCEATDQETPLVQTPIKFLSANTSTGRDTTSLTTIHNSLELRQLYILHVKDILSRVKRSSNPCPLYHYPVPSGICEPCICGKGEQPKKDCGYGPSGQVSEPCERCGDNHFSTDGRIDGCEVCTDCGQRGFQTTCNVNRTEDATCVCDEGQKLDKSGQCLPVCCKCRVYDSTEETDNFDACRQAFGRPAIDGGYLCTDNEIYAHYPCQDYQPPTTTPHPTTTQTTTVPVTNGTTHMSATTTAQGTTIGGTNKTSTSSPKPSTTVPNNITVTPVGTDTPPQGDGGRHQKLILGLSLGISSIVITAAVGIGCHTCRKRKIWRQLKCLKKCFNRSKPSNESESRKELLPADQSDTESGPERPPVRPSSPDQFEEQEEIGVAEEQGGGKPDDAVPIAEVDDIELNEMKDEHEKPEDESEEQDVPVVPAGLHGINNKSDSDDSAEPEERLEDTDQEDSDENDQEECDRLREVPDWIKDLPLTSILNEEDLLDKLKVLLEQEGRTHYKNIGSKLFKLSHDELLHIEYHRVSTSPTVAVLKEGDSSFPNMKIRRLLYYVTGEPLTRQDVANCIVRYFTELGRDAVMAKLKQ